MDPALDPAVTVRRLGCDDLPLARAAFAMMAAVFEEDDGPAGPLDDVYLTDLFSHNAFHALVAVVDDAPVGCLTAHTLPMTRCAATEVFIDDLAVAPAHQRRGIGRGLVRALLAQAAAEGASSVFVPADDEDEHALDFYRALGGQAAPVTVFTFEPPVDAWLRCAAGTRG